MMLIEETRTLRRDLVALAARPDWALLARSDLLADKPLPRWRDRIWRTLRRGLARIRLMPPPITRYAWLPTLKHAPVAAGAQALLIWAVGMSRDELRLACQGIARHAQADPVWVPVLVTDVADFAWFSRLGWLVEYLPDLAGEGPSYVERKKRHLAWLYRDAIAVPAAVGLVDELQWQRVLKRV